MKERINYIDVAKGLAIILVVYGHAAVQFEGTSFYEGSLYLQSKIIFSFVMPIFFIISGSFQRIRLESPNFEHKTYLNKIARSILLPFYSLSIVFLFINLSLKSYINAPSFKNMLFALSMQQSNGDLLPSGVLWFLFTLFSFSLITYFSFKILKTNPIILILLAIILRSKINIYCDSYYLSFNTISRFFIFYILGYYFYGTIIKKPIYQIKYLFLFLASYCTLLIIPCSFYSNYPPILLMMETISLIGARGLLASLFIIGISFHLAKKFNDGIIIKMLTYCGAYSILIYVFHMPTFTILKKMANMLSLDPNYTKLLFLFLLGILLPLIYGKLLSMNERIYRVLLGRRP